MSGINLFLILTHCLAFIAGAACIVIFNNVMDKKASHRISDRNHHRHSVGESAKTHQQPVCSPNVKPAQNKEKAEVKSVTLPQQKKPSPKELRNIQRKEDRARKRQEELDRKAAIEEAKRKASFDPFTSKPENVVYTDLAVSDGKLVLCSLGKTSYYHYWEYEGRYFFEFSCEKSKVAKAVNNRSAIIDPFCQKDSSSVDVDTAKNMIIDRFGELDNELNVISKSIIIYQ